MANAIHALFTPGLIDRLEKVNDFNRVSKVKLQFTKPLNANNLRINLFEVDSWVSDGRNFQESPSSKVKPLGEIVGKL